MKDMEHSLDNLPESLKGRAEELRKLAAPCVKLVAAATTGPLDPLASKYGGAPCLSDKDEWPACRSGKPMTFIGQVNFHEINAKLRNSGASAPPGMPDRGILLFFYDMEEMVWGYDPKHRDEWCIRWVAGPLLVERFVSAPEQEWPPNPCSLEPRLYQTLPSHDDEAHSLPGLSEKQLDDYCELCDAIKGKVLHQLLGHPCIIQSDPRYTAQMVSNGVYLGGDGDPGMPHSKLKELEKGVRGWRLLWQIDSDDVPGFMWGDMGMIHIMIRAEDLAAHRFDRLWLQLQCY